VRGGLEAKPAAIVKQAAARNPPLRQGGFAAWCVQLTSTGHKDDSIEELFCDGLGPSRGTPMRPWYRHPTDTAGQKRPFGDVESVPALARAQRLRARLGFALDRALPVNQFFMMIVRSTLLSSELVTALGEVGAKLRNGGDVTSSLGVALVLLAQLDPGHVARADGEIAAAASLDRQPPQSPSTRLFSRESSGASQLLRTPGLEYLFVFHRDGRLREAALLKITGGLPSPFLFAAVLWRLNDWAAPVRQAATRCARRSFPATRPAVIARAAAELLVRQATWRRWEAERSILNEVFGRSDVAAELADLMSVETVGPQASTLRYALRTPALDQHLERIASRARQPSVRAVALGTLIDRKAEWPSGTALRWINKPMGVQRRETVFDHRLLTVTPSRRALIERGINDRSAVVRRVALTGIIRHMLETPDARAWAEPLAFDRAPSVRERAEFILRGQTA
jgi:hypothetical protein